MRATRSRINPLSFEPLEARDVPAGQLIASSFFDAAIYEFDADTGVRTDTLVAPNSNPLLSGPAGTTIGPDGDLYISSQLNDAILRYDFQTDTLSTFIGAGVLAPIAATNGTPTFAPAGLRFGPDGELYVSQNGGQTSQAGAVVRFNVTLTGGTLTYDGTFTTVANVAAGLVQPSGLTFGTSVGDTNNLYVSSATGNVVKLTGATTTATPSQFITGNAPASGNLNFPAGLTFGSDGDLFVVDLGATSNLGQVLRFNPNGSLDSVYVNGDGMGAGDLAFQFPSDAVFDNQGRLLTANLGPAFPPNQQGSINRYPVGGGIGQTLVSSSQIPAGTGTTGFSPSQLAYIAPITLSPTTLPVGEAGLAYNQTITGSGGFGAITLTVSGITNNTGLAINGSGTGAITLTGTPTSAGTVSFTITPSDVTGPRDPQTYSFVVNPAVVLTPTALPSAETGVPYNRTITSTGGTAPVTLAVSGLNDGGTGLTVTGSGSGTITVSGTPTTAGTVTFTVTPTSGTGTGTGTTYTFAVNAPSALSPASLPTGEVGFAYNQTITLAGGSGAETLAVTDLNTGGTGLMVTGDGTGTITVMGTPTAAGTVTFTVTPTDGVTLPARTYSFAVAPAVALSPATLPGGVTGTAYNQTITSAGGAGTVTLAVSGLTNANGLTITGGSTVTITGAPTAAGTTTFTVTPTSAAGTGPGVTYTIGASTPIVVSPTTLPAGQVGLAYNRTITSTGGTAPVALTVSSLNTGGTGLTVTGSGTGTIIIGGTPNATGTVSFTATPSDANGPQPATTYSFVVNPAVMLTPATLPSGVVGTAYNRTITSTGGTAPVTLAVSGLNDGGTGLTVTGSGSGTITVSGTPTTAGTVTFTVTPTSGTGTGTGTTYTFAVNPAIIVTPTTLPAGQVGTAYNQTISGTGGTAPVVLTVSNLNAGGTGLTVTGSGSGTITVSGTPTTAGTVSFTVTPSDANGPQLARTYSFAVAPIPQPPVTPPAPAAPAFFTDAFIGGNVLVLRGNGVAGGTQILAVPPGSSVSFADLNGDGRGDVLLFIPNLTVVLDGSTGATLATVTPDLITLFIDQNGDGRGDTTLIRTGLTVAFDGATGRPLFVIIDTNGDGRGEMFML